MQGLDFVGPLLISFWKTDLVWKFLRLIRWENFVTTQKSSMAADEENSAHVVYSNPNGCLPDGFQVWIHGVWTIGIKTEIRNASIRCYCTMVLNGRSQNDHLCSSYETIPKNLS